MELSRQQKRRLERAHVPPDKWPAVTLSDYLTEPARNVKRGELPGAVEKLVRLYELQKRMNRPDQRALRWVRKKLTFSRMVQGD